MDSFRDSYVTLFRSVTKSIEELKKLTKLIASLHLLLCQKTSIYFLYLFKQIFSHLCQNFLFTA